MKNARLFWTLLVLCLLAAVFTWWWFEERITDIDEKIENIEK